MSTTTTARVSANLPHPSTLQAVARGVLLLIGGLVVILVVEPVGPKMLYWMPLIIGLTYLVSSIAGGRSGGLWVPGLMVTAWGVATTTVLSGTIRADFTATTILAIGIGAILATQLPRFGIPCNALAIAVIIFLIGGLELLEAQAGGIFVKGWPWGVFLVLGGLWELRPAVTRPATS
ncbi:MAG: hypothetical protein WKF73_18415 [Nocardioidaceae bacterium]|jgi:hypothetical protein